MLPNLSPSRMSLTLTAVVLAADNLAASGLATAERKWSEAEGLDLTNVT